MSSGRLYRLLRSLAVESRGRSHLLISLVFLLVFASFVFSLGRYWQGTLQPRLYLAGETQAKILAQSQAAILVEVLEHSKPDQRAQKLYDAVQEILIVEDPAIGGRIVLGLELQVDYDAVVAAPGSLDLHEGETHCASCFQAPIALISHAGVLFGIADFNISNGYFLALSAEMKSKLFAESSLALCLLAVVWVAMLVMFHRLHTAKQMIEASDRAKTRFMANVTHELRTPLNAILGYTQLYKADAVLMATHAQGIETIDRSAELLLLLINDILDFSRVDENNLKLHPREVCMAVFLNTLVEMTQVRARLKDIDFRYQFPAQLPVRVRVDDKRLRQVLLNLLSNAVKFTERGEVVLMLETLASNTPHSLRLRFSVLDSGIGIDKSEQKNIFIAFHQLDNPITRAEGSGLGLTISQRLLALMGTQLKLESNPGQGSLFWFEIELPLLDDAMVATAAPDQAAGKSQQSLTLPPSATIDTLIERARCHNVLAVRELVRDLEQDAAYAAFVEYIQPYIRHYRFKQLVTWLDSLKGQ